MDEDIFYFEKIRVDLDLLGQEVEALTTWDSYMEVLLEEWQWERCKRWLRWVKGLTLSTAGHTWVFQVAGGMYRHWRDLPAAEKSFHRALSLTQETQDCVSEAIICNNLALLYQENNQYAEAEEMYLRTKTLETALGNQEGYLRTDINLANLFREQGFWERALTTYVAITESPDLPPLGIIGLYNNLGTVFEALERWEEAETAYFAEIDVLEAYEQSYSKEAVRTVSNLAQLRALQGAYESAVACYTLALQICEVINDLYSTATTWNNLATIHQEHGALEDAENAYQHALQIHQIMGNRSGIATVLNNLASCYQDAERFTDAIEFYERSLTVAEELESTYSVGRTYANLGVLYRKINRFDKAMDYYEQAIQFFVQIGNTYHEASVIANLCSLLWNQLEKTPIQGYWQRGWDLAITYEHPLLQRNLASLQADYQLVIAQDPRAAALWHAKTLILMADSPSDVFGSYTKHLQRSLQTLNSQSRSLVKEFIATLEEELRTSRTPPIQVLLQTLHNLAT